MKQYQQVYYVTNGLNEFLLGKVDRFIEKREVLLSKMNNYSLSKASSIIEETNDLITLTAKQTKIADINDSNPIKTDNFMSVPDKNVIKVTPQNAYIMSSSFIKDNKNEINEPKYQRLLTLPKSTHSIISSSKGYTPTKSIKTQKTQKAQQPPVPLYVGEKEQQQTHVNRMRTVKRLQAQQEARDRKRMQQTNQLKKKNDLSKVRVMFDFQCRASKLQNLKSKGPLNIGGLQIKINSFNKIDKSELIQKDFETNQVKKVEDMINITKREKEEQENKLKRKGLLKADHSSKQKEYVPVQSIRVNAETHQQTEDAIKVEKSGVKLTINSRQFKSPNSMVLRETSIKQRLTKLQYSEFKKNEENRKIMFLRKNDDNQRTKSQLRVRTEYSQNQNSPFKRFSSQRKFIPLYGKSASEQSKSRVQVVNPEKHKILMNDQEEYVQQFKIESKPSMRSQITRYTLSEVDKYNLMYVKYSGNPPNNIKEVAHQIRQSNSFVQKQKKLGINSRRSEKYNWIGENRIIQTRKKRVESQK